MSRLIASVRFFLGQTVSNMKLALYLSLFLLVSAQYRNFNYTGLEEDDSCDPECRHDGVCANGLCFCKSPWGGDYCENDLGVHSRISLVLALILTFLFAAGGFLTPFVLRFIYDCFCARRELAADEEGEGWKP